MEKWHGGVQKEQKDKTLIDPQGLRHVWHVCKWNIVGAGCISGKEEESCLREVKAKSRGKSQEWSESMMIVL